jgi:hypothetical protein
LPDLLRRDDAATASIESPDGNCTALRTAVRSDQPLAVIDGPSLARSNFAVGDVVVIVVEDQVVAIELDGGQLTLSAALARRASVPVTFRPRASWHRSGHPSANHRASAWLPALQRWRAPDLHGRAARILAMGLYEPLGGGSATSPKSSSSS